MLFLSADFRAEGGQKFGEEMYEAVSHGQAKEDSRSGDNGFDSPVENKFSPSATPPR